MNGLKNFLLNLFFILVIIVLGGFLLPSKQKIEKTIVINAPISKVMKALSKRVDSLAINKKETPGKIVFTSKMEEDTLQNIATVVAVKEGCELTRVVVLDAGSNFLKKYGNLANRQIEEGEVTEEMILIKQDCEKK